ncbi:gamma-glutamyl-gamma-aminobutyrate hydrolase family protein [Streptococcus pluranimalium]|uniref:gamma-glutamyl-gamma-aminobutyrate hydrolase family protein n=1 Tax=Streptococcus pluranimalium TaxID=82348 RepID=UPI00313A337A
MGKPIIGITSTETKVSPDGLMIHSSVSRHFARAVIKAGGVPIHIPVCSPDMAESYVSMIDRLILSGGQDVQPSLYQQDNDKDTSLYFPERDDFEFALVQEAIRQKKPIMGVCRGIQLYNTVQGGSLNLDIKGHQHENPEVLVHGISVEKGNAIHDIFGNKGDVNSLHHQSIKDLAPGLNILARDSKDETIEAVQSRDKRSFLGVQWHPEYLLDINPKSQSLFNYFLSL